MLSTHYLRSLKAVERLTDGPVVRAVDPGKAIERYLLSTDPTTVDVGARKPDFGRVFCPCLVLKLGHNGPFVLTLWIFQFRGSTSAEIDLRVQTLNSLGSIPIQLRFQEDNNLSQARLSLIFSSVKGLSRQPKPGMSFVSDN